MRKIQIRKFAVMNLRSFVVGVSRVFLCAEQASIDAPTPYVQSGSPSFFDTVPTNSFETAGVVWLAPPIALILAVRASPQILSAVVQFIMVSVIHGFVTLWLHDFPMHQDGTSSRIPAIGKVPHFFRAATGPAPSREPLEIGNVHNRVLPSRKWDKAIRFIQGLNNYVTLHGKSLTQAGHKSSVHEHTRRVHNFNTGGALLAG
jgi:hypothetical protein